jgi:hypothetical protein
MIVRHSPGFSHKTRLPFYRHREDDTLVFARIESHELLPIMPSKARRRLFGKLSIQRGRMFREAFSVPVALSPGIRFGDQ